MHKEGKRAIILLFGICLWIFYIFQEEMAYYGIYNVISYGTHELATTIPLLCILVTIGWAIYLFVKMIKKQSDKSDRIFVIILCCLMIWQGYYIYQKESEHSTTVIATIENVDEQKLEIVIRDTNGQTMTLDSPMLVNSMVETNGQEYFIKYTWSERMPKKKRLQMIEIIK